MKMFEENGGSLSDSLVKTTAWTYKTNLNIPGYSPLKWITGKAVSISGLIMGIKATESMPDSETVQRAIEIKKIISKFREADI